MSDKWTLYHQTGPDGQEWGVKIRPGYIVTGFAREDAEAVVARQNAAVSRPAGDVLERARAAIMPPCSPTGDCIMDELIAEVEKYRDYYHQEQITANLHYQNLVVYKEKAESSEKEVERLRNLPCADVAAYDRRIQEMAARIKELEAIRDEAFAIIEEKNRYEKRLEAAFLEAETERKFYATINGMNSDFDWKSYPEKPQNGIHKEWFREQAREKLERM